MDHDGAANRPSKHRSKLVAGTRFERIPQLIHQTWKERTVPSRWRGYQISWQMLHPGWQYRLWTDSDNRELISDRYPWFLQTYDDLPRDIQRVDAAKYFILYTFGGVYADLDCECLQPVDDLAACGGLVVGRSTDHVIDGGFLASAPAHGYWPRVFSAMQSPHIMARLLHALPRFIGVAGFDAAHVLFRTGPQMLRMTLVEYRRDVRRSGGDGITILSPSYLCGRSWWRRFEPHGNHEGYVVHHYANSWLEKNEAWFVNRFTARLLWFLVVGLLLMATVISIAML